MTSDAREVLFVSVNCINSLKWVEDKLKDFFPGGW